MTFLTVGLIAVGVLAVTSIYLHFESSLSRDFLNDIEISEIVGDKINNIEERIANIEAGFVHDLDEKLLEIDQKLAEIDRLEDRVGSIEAGFVHDLNTKLLEIDERLDELEAQLIGSE